MFIQAQIFEPLGDEPAEVTEVLTAEDGITEDSPLETGGTGEDGTDEDGTGEDGSSGENGTGEGDGSGPDIPEDCAGCFSQEMEPDDTDKAFFEGLKGAIEEASGEMFTEFDAIKFIVQIVAGKNYIVKYSIGNGVFFIAKIFEPLAGPAEIEAVKAATEDSPLENF